MQKIYQTTTQQHLSFVCLLLPPGCLCFCFVCLKKRKMELVGGGKLTRWLSGNDRWPFPSGRHLSERWRNCSASWRCWGASAIQTCWANRQRKRKTSKNYCPDERKIWEMRYRSGLAIDIAFIQCVCVCVVSAHFERPASKNQNRNRDAKEQSTTRTMWWIQKEENQNEKGVNRQKEECRGRQSNGLYRSTAGMAGTCHGQLTTRHIPPSASLGLYMFK